jgi:hypothetical protein
MEREARDERWEEAEMTLIAANTTLWGATLGLGAVVLLVVTLLLGILYRVVRNIDSDLSSLVDGGDQVARNTAKIDDLLTTAGVLNSIKKEVLIHERFLARK